MSDTKPGHRCRNRAVEWLCAAIMLLMAVGMTAFDAGIGVSSFRLVLETGLTQAHIHVFVLIIAPLRVAALIANGSWPRIGPWARGFGAICGALLWGQLAMALIGYGEVTRSITVGVYVYIGLAGGELFSLGRALADGRNTHSDR